MLCVDAKVGDCGTCLALQRQVNFAATKVLKEREGLRSIWNTPACQASGSAYHACSFASMFASSALDVKLVTEDSMQLMALLMSVEGFCSPSAETRDQPAPKWVQQLAKGQSFFTPTLGDNYPKALDLVATFRAMEASPEVILNKIIINLGYVVSFDPRDGKANMKGLKMVGVCVRAIKKYLRKPATSV